MAVISVSWYAATSQIHFLKCENRQAQLVSYSHLPRSVYKKREKILKTILRPPHLPCLFTQLVKPSFTPAVPRAAPAQGFAPGRLQRRHLTRSRYCRSRSRPGRRPDAAPDPGVPGSCFPTTRATAGETPRCYPGSDVAL